MYRIYFDILTLKTTSINISVYSCDLSLHANTFSLPSIKCYAYKDKRYLFLFHYLRCTNNTKFCTNILREYVTIHVLYHKEKTRSMKNIHQVPVKLGNIQGAVIQSFE